MAGTLDVRATDVLAVSLAFFWQTCCCPDKSQ
jgi:hypothetical protein